MLLQVNKQTYDELKVEVLSNSLVSRTTTSIMIFLNKNLDSLSISASGLTPNCHETRLIKLKAGQTGVSDVST